MQGVEAEQHAAAQGIHAADQRGIHHAGLDQACGLGEDLGAGRTRRGHGDAGAAQAGSELHEATQRMRGMHLRPVEIGGEVARVAFSGKSRIGFLAGADAGSGGTHHHGHAVAAMPRHHGGEGLQYSILLQGQPGEAVVAALPLMPCGGQGCLFQACDAAYPAVEPLAVAKVIVAQATLA